jgi:hypothetical protein
MTLSFLDGIMFELVDLPIYLWSATQRVQHPEGPASPGALNNMTAASGETVSPGAHRWY